MIKQNYKTLSNSIPMTIEEKHKALKKFNYFFPEIIKLNANYHEIIDTVVIETSINNEYSGNNKYNKNDINDKNDIINIEFWSIFGGTPYVAFDVDYIVNSAYQVKYLLLDFEKNTPFHIQILHNHDDYILGVLPIGISDKYLYSHYPILYTHWATNEWHCFYPKNSTEVRIEVPGLKENGIGLFVLETDKQKKIEALKLKKLRFYFTFPCPQTMVDRFTLLIVRNHIKEE